MNIAPIVAFFAITSIGKYKVPLIGLAIVIVLILPSLKKDNEILAIEGACNQVKKIKYSKLYTEHCFVNYFLREPFKGGDTSNFKNIYQVKKNDIMIWENHYGRRKIPPETLQDNWSILWHKKNNNNFVVVILQKK